MSLPKAVIAVGCNCEKNIDKWFRSIIQQTRKDFNCFMAVDSSADKTFSAVEKIAQQDQRFHVVAKNVVGQGALYNRYVCTQKVKDPETIIMHLDLDDAFYTPKAIEIVEQAYQDNDCWLTYGS